MLANNIFKCLFRFLTHVESLTDVADYLVRFVMGALYVIEGQFYFLTWSYYEVDD